jgi:aminoglycoside phosphotransferase (APT) family kinase protein
LTLLSSSGHEPVSVELVGILKKRAGYDLEIVGVTDEGQSGAAYVRWPDGHESVVTTAFASLSHMQATARILAEVRELGIPVPVHEVLFDCGDGIVAVVQERLPGATWPTAQATPDMIGAIVTMNDRFAGLLADRPDIVLPDFRPRFPRDPAVINLVERDDQRACAMVQTVRDALDRQGPGGDDLLHSDLTVANTLFDDHGQITGIIDWNYGAKRGDRQYGLVKLLHTLSYAVHTTKSVRATDSMRQLDEILAERLDSATFRSYWADQTINMMYVSRRWGSEADFRTYLRMGEERLS